MDQYSSSDAQLQDMTYEELLRDWEGSPDDNRLLHCEARAGMNEWLGNDWLTETEHWTPVNRPVLANRNRNRYFPYLETETDTYNI